MPSETVSVLRLSGSPHLLGGCCRSNPSQMAASNDTLSASDAVGQKSMDQGVKSFIDHSYVGNIRQLVAGGVAGAVSKTCTAPLARLTILFQVEGMQSKNSSVLRRPNIRKEAYRIAVEEGIAAFWKGNGVTIVHRLPYSAISFFAYEKYKMSLLYMAGVDTDEGKFTVGMGTRLIAGGAAGITAASLTYPLDLVRTRLAVQRNERYYQGIMHTLITTSRDEGLRGLYKGLGATLLGVGPNIAINFSVYETLKSAGAENRSGPPGVWSSLAFGSVAGIVSSTATFPLDLVRRRMQMRGGTDQVYKGGTFSTLSQIIKTEGWKGLYRGIFPEYLKVVPSVGIVFMTYEFMKSHLTHHRS